MTGYAFHAALFLLNWFLVRLNWNWARREPDLVFRLGYYFSFTWACLGTFTDEAMVIFTGAY
jgi:hypothetical protein